MSSMQFTGPAVPSMVESWVLPVVNQNPAGEGVNIQWVCTEAFPYVEHRADLVY